MLKGQGLCPGYWLAARGWSDACCVRPADLKGRLYGQDLHFLPEEVKSAGITLRKIKCWAKSWLTAHLVNWSQSLEYIKWVQSEAGPPIPNALVVSEAGLQSRTFC